MEALYHGSQEDAMLCARNLAQARLLLDGTNVIVKLNDTHQVAAYCVVPIIQYARRYTWTPSRLRGR
jgi:hypothetical protein